MKKIVIIGAGQLGSRHLQGIAQTNFDISIEIVEPFESSRITAEQRYLQINNNTHVKDIKFFDCIEKLSTNLDLVIVATGSDVRSKVITELLNTKKVSNLVLEKVLFQTIEEYHDIEKLLDKNNVKCWVNHPRRMFPSYQKLKDKLKEANQISYCFQSGDWGLGCNALHFIDHLSFLSNSSELNISNKYLDENIYDSKRKGFVEFNGLLVGSIDKHNFSLYSNASATPTNFTINSDVLLAKIDETNGEIQMATKENNWQWITVKEKIVYFQSELSNVLVEDILKNEKCELPTYELSMKLHIPFIKCLLNHMEKISGQKHTVCPIT